MRACERDRRGAARDHGRGCSGARKEMAPRAARARGETCRRSATDALFVRRNMSPRASVAPGAVTSTFTLSPSLMRQQSVGSAAACVAGSASCEGECKARRKRQRKRERKREHARSRTDICENALRHLRKRVQGGGADLRAPARDVLAEPVLDLQIRKAGGTCGRGTRRVQLVRRDGRDVSTLYGREGGGGGNSCPARASPARARALRAQERGAAQTRGGWRWIAEIGSGRGGRKRTAASGGGRQED
jgi:hypothetical protein